MMIRERLKAHAAVVLCWAVLAVSLVVNIWLKSQDQRGPLMSTITTVSGLVASMLAIALSFWIGSVISRRKEDKGHS